MSERRQAETPKAGVGVVFRLIWQLSEYHQSVWDQLMSKRP